MRINKALGQLSCKDAVNGLLALESTHLQRTVAYQRSALACAAADSDQAPVLRRQLVAVKAERSAIREEIEECLDEFRAR